VPPPPRGQGQPLWVPALGAVLLRSLLPAPSGRGPPFGGQGLFRCAPSLVRLVFRGGWPWWVAPRPFSMGGRAPRRPVGPPPPRGGWCSCSCLGGSSCFGPLRAPVGVPSGGPKPPPPAPGPGSRSLCGEWCPVLCVPRVRGAPWCGVFVPAPPFAGGLRPRRPVGPPPLAPPSRGRPPGTRRPPRRKSWCPHWEAVVPCRAGRRQHTRAAAVLVPSLLEGAEGYPTK